MRQIFDMVILISLIGIVFLLSFFEKRFTFRFKKIMLFTVVLLISFVIGNKVIGTDHQNYVEMYRNTPIIPIDLEFFKSMFDFGLEPFFVALISILKSIGFSDFAFFFISAIIPLYLVFSVVVKKESKFPLITFFIFLLMNLLKGPVDIIRHFFAAAIYLHALYSLSKNQRLRFYLKSLFSVTMHYSNIAIFFVRPFLNHQWSIMKYVGTLVVSAITAVLLKNPLKDFVADLNFTSPILIKFKYYFLYSTEKMELMNNLHVFLWYSLQYMPVIFVIMINMIAIYHVKEIKKDKFYYILLNSQIIGSILVVFFTAFDAHNLGLRINYLLSIGCFFIVKELMFKHVKGKDKTIFFVFSILFLIVYNVVITLYLAGVYSPHSSLRLI